MLKLALLVGLVALAFFASAANPTNPPPGTLLQVGITGTIGVLLDEQPTDTRTRTANFAIGGSDSYWRAAVIRQLWLTSYRLIFRPYWYRWDNTGHPTAGQLPIPMDQLSISFTSAAVRTTVDGHDVVKREYTVSSWIVTDTASAMRADPAFKPNTGTGIVREKFTLPIDPYLIYQRTGFDCMDEGGFPVSSLDGENPEFYFDDSCTPEPPFDATAGPCGACHCSGTSTKSCVDSVKDNVGRADVQITYTRMPWNENFARSIEALVPYNITYENGADIIPSAPDLLHNYLGYQYFTPSSCTNLECGGTPGWRRLLYFDASNINIGGKGLEIGFISYEAEDASTFDPLAFHNLYYWDSCHKHPHFSAYADYAFGTSPGRKQGFCIQTTGRTLNARWSPIVTDSFTCSFQGVETGWNDAYNAGIPCQWVDVTDVKTKTKSVTQPLTLHSNPKNWLCEGTPIRDSAGAFTWTPTGEFTATGQSIDKQACTPTPDYADNNVATAVTTIPVDGNGVLTATCSHAGHNLGPKRDCEMTLRTQLSSCTAGAQVNLVCTIASNKPSQVLRVCESSRKLQSGLACRYNEAHMLGNFVVRPGISNAVSFTCPAARDSIETGGVYSTYAGPTFNGGDATAPITCQVV